MKWMLILLLVVGLSGGLISCASSDGGSDSTDAFAEEGFGNDDGGGDEFAEESAAADDSGGGDEFGEESAAADDSGGGDEFGEESAAADDAGGGDEFAEESAPADDFGGDEFAAEEGEAFDEFAAEDDELTQGVNQTGESLDTAGESATDEFGGELAQDPGAADEFADQALTEGESDLLSEDGTANQAASGQAAEQDLGAAGDPLADDGMGTGLSEDTALAQPGMAEETAMGGPVQPDEAALGEPAMPEGAPMDTGAAIPEETALTEMGAAESAVAPQGPPVRVTNIGFRAEEAGGTVVIETSGTAGFQVRAKPETRQYVIEIANAVLPQKLTRPIITKEFTQSQIGSVNAYQSPGSSVARVVVQMKEGAPEPSVEQQGNMILVVGGVAQQMAAGGPAAPDQTMEDAPMETPTEAMPEQAYQEEYLPEGGPAAPDAGQVAYEQQPAVGADLGNVLKSQTMDEFLATNEKFYGRKINIEVTKTEVADALKLIAEQSGLNMVVSSEVKGLVDLKLRDIPWDQALVIVLRSQRLGYHRQGNVLRVAPLAQLRAEVADAKAVEDAKIQAQPLAVKVISVSYNNVATLEPQVKSFLSERGKVIADVRTSSLVVTDTPDKLATVEKLIKSLDIAPPQVLIEGKVVEASDNFTKELGVNWSFSGDPVQLGDNNGVPINVTPSLSINPTDAAVGTNGLAFNVNVGTLALFGNLNARLALFERKAKIKVLSSPRITTLTNEKATINQLTQIPLITTTLQGDNVTQGVTFKDVNLSLEVTPQVTVDDSIILDVNILREFAGEIVESSTQARAINSRRATTKVLVQNGQTAVIGGVYQSDATEAERGVPFFRKLPLIGRLFESRSRTDSKNELLIFITPRVLGKSISATN